MTIREFCKTPYSEQQRIIIFQYDPDIIMVAVFSGRFSELIQYVDTICKFSDDSIEHIYTENNTIRMFLERNR